MQKGWEKKLVISARNFVKALSGGTITIDREKQRLPFYWLYLISEVFMLRLLQVVLKNRFKVKFRLGSVKHFYCGYNFSVTGRNNKISTKQMKNRYI